MDNMEHSQPEQSVQEVQEVQPISQVEDVGQTQETQEVVAEQPKIKVKYDKEEKELSYDEAVTLAQKGMNYDRLNEKYDSLKAKEHAIKLVEKLAEQNGMIS